MSVNVRFAPSPTGLVHIGNIRTAILNWLFARKNGGTFLLRLDDTDLERSKPEFADAIREDLIWLGLDWDSEMQQSGRTARYDDVAQHLKSIGRLYPCFETPDELDRRRKRQMARGLPPIYDRSALKLSDDERAAFEADGRKPHWRFRLNNTEENDELAPAPTLVSWNDVIRGDQMVDIGSVSDPVLIREDGSYLYTLPSVIDDMDMGITHIVRGDDHLTNTGVQIDLFEALEGKPPAFGHHSLLVSADGQALSKRLGALSIQSLREQEIEPMAVAAHAALIGTSHAIEPHDNMGELVDMFDAGKISLAPGRFDFDELKGLNAKVLHTTLYDRVSDRLESLGVLGGETFWNAVRANLEKVSDAKVWWDVVNNEIVPVIEDGDLCATALDVLPVEPWDETTWGTWTKAVKSATGKKGRALFHPLRLAITGLENGPELKTLLPLIGREKIASRLGGDGQ